MRALNVYPQFQHTDPSSQTRKDFVTDQDVRWCPGCGDYSILAQVQRVMPTLGIPREKYVFVSGIGCSSRFPYYMETYGIHSIHGRAPAVATGLKSARPDLQVWVVTGDGDALSIGGNHFMHVLRRNVDLKILMFNNQIYGLTKGQYSPTSPVGKKAKSTPMGSIDYPIDPISIALGANGTFIARSFDVHANHLQGILKRAAEHKGTAFVEIYQNCNIFNDGAFSLLTEKETKSDHVVEIEHGKPLRFGKNLERGIALSPSLEPMVVDVATFGEDKLFVYDETSEIAALLVSRLRSHAEQPAALGGAPEFPTPIGVFRSVSRPSYDKLLGEQIEQAKGRKKQSVQELLDDGQWIVK
ncbi:MAG TPA: 2-oxoacid:ferredoxin oxidoreductase subunit beta [Polyangiales bacterium]|nr:2-oxoacid:ferredoxin oxidoreductase subunit beta [Polyangiales bacterium]